MKNHKSETRTNFSWNKEKIRNWKWYLIDSFLLTIVLIVVIIVFITGRYIHNTIQVIDTCKDTTNKIPTIIIPSQNINKTIINNNTTIPEALK